MFGTSKKKRDAKVDRGEGSLRDVEETRHHMGSPGTAFTHKHLTLLEVEALPRGGLILGALDNPLL